MKHSQKLVHLAAASLAISAALLTTSATAAGAGWSVVPYVGISQLGDQSPGLSGAADIADGTLDIAVDTGFTAGLGFRYDYPGSRWSSEFGWEYRSNDSDTTDATGLALPGGNYASNIFYINGRYALGEGKAWTPWVGAGLTWVQEVDLDSENTDGERSFEDSGAVGFQAMAGVDYRFTDRLYLTTELRYSSLTGLDLSEENGDGRISDIDYQPVTLGVGLGLRF